MRITIALLSERITILTRESEDTLLCREFVKLANIF